MTRPWSLLLDDAGIALVRRRLQLLRASQQSTTNSPRFKYGPGASEAAVLVLLCNVNGRPSLLFEERHRRLAAHGGEVCFAGGKADAQDPSLEHTALRETHEELGLDPGSVTVLGRLPPVPNKTATLRVHPVVGVWTGGWPIEPSRLVLSRAEVHRAFALPIDHFYDPAMCESLPLFRDTGVSVPVYRTDKRGLRIWGLTAFILNEFLRAVVSGQKNGDFMNEGVS
ncbi:hypothetical protein GGI04_000873 [Coemansia thaxteri]|uniref:Nudix hydrolase domain-containing protein n=1 Tax=Coemansia thaxteri TaxID=2663907 RepID=A0A9W8BIQ3_9FUNG|nr:hypothetical protein H4R26_001343 [Coemansia thaxteri]KAJ2008910.1 hypothetical protein GGI04_000873 [Coemansia thaxteri]KAJ2473525.1 hypothetical protein GGI02_000780 [Coemansia sp. RSA 2322]